MDDEPAPRDAAPSDAAPSDAVPNGRAPSDPAASDAQRALRAQLLASEHWSLLASRSTTQSEVLTRIAIFLTLVSASLLTLGVLGPLVGQGRWFGAAAITTLVLLSLLGSITQLRVFTASMDDLMLVLAMNRIRAGYVALDPGIERYLLTSAHDDQPGTATTYYAYRRRDRLQVLASSMMIVTVVDAVLHAMLVGAVLLAVGAHTALAIGAGAAAAIVSVVAWERWGYLGYRSALATHRPVSPTPEVPDRAVPPRGVSPRTQP